MKIVSISDIHGELNLTLPDGDILTISGDICPVRGSHHPTTQEHWIKNHFHTWCDKLIKNGIFNYVVYCNGNHDFYFEKLMKNNKETDFRLTLPENVYYLRDNMVEIEGIKIYGTPFTPTFGSWANMCPEDILDQIYEKIPEGLDILLSHGPAYIWNDMIEQYPERCWEDDKHIGSKALRKHVLRSKPSWLLVGHIHSGSHNVTEIKHLDDNLNATGITRSVNVSILDEDYEIRYKPFVFEIVKG